MDKNTYEALKRVTQQARFLLNRKYANRKPLTLDEVFDKATTTRDIVAVEGWIEEEAKKYKGQLSCPKCGEELAGNGENCLVCMVCDYKVHETMV